MGPFQIYYITNQETYGVYTIDDLRCRQSVRFCTFFQLDLFTFRPSKTRRVRAVRLFTENWPVLLSQEYLSLSSHQMQQAGPSKQDAGSKTQQVRRSKQAALQLQTQPRASAISKSPPIKFRMIRAPIFFLVSMTFMDSIEQSIKIIQN